MVETQTSRERGLAVLVGEEADRPPVTPTGGWWVAQTSGLPLPEVFAKGEVLAAAHLDVQRRAGYDAVYTYFDALAIPEAFGCRVELKEFGDRLLATSASWTHNLPTLRELVKENGSRSIPRRPGAWDRDGARVAVETPQAGSSCSRGSAKPCLRWSRSRSAGATWPQDAWPLPRLGRTPTSSSTTQHRSDRRHSRLQVLPLPRDPLLMLTCARSAAFPHCDTSPEEQTVFTAQLWP